MLLSYQDPHGDVHYLKHFSPLGDELDARMIMRKYPVGSVVSIRCDPENSARYDLFL